MATTPSPVFAQQFADFVLALTSTNTTVAASLAAGSTNGMTIKSLTITSTETSVVHDIAIFKQVSGTNYLIGTVGVPVNSGFASTAPTVNALANIAGLPVDANGNPVLEVPSGTTIFAGALVTITAAKTITLVATAEEL
jgi:hypothetical protein